MVIPIPSNNKRFRIRIRIKALFPFEMGIIAFDATKINTHYFRRKVLFTKADFDKGKIYRDIIIPMPFSPNTLSVELFDKNSDDDSAYIIEKFELEKMPEPILFADKAMHDYIEFAQNFCEKAGYAKSGFYHNPEHSFLIHYVPQITGQFGEALATPARCHRVTGRIQVSMKQFRQFSIPVRMFIMLHERQHFTIPTREEKPADLAALKLYLDMGYPKIEAVYAATKVFRMHPNSIGPNQVTRTKDIIDFIDKYSKNNRTLKKS